MKQAMKKTDQAKAVQSQPSETVKQPKLQKTPDAKANPKTQPISRFLEASCDCV